MKPKLLEAYMRTAKIFADLSHAKRLHVGAIVVKDDRIISIGYNGMPAGWDNNCEDKEYPDRYDKHSEWTDLKYPLQEPDGTYYRLKTRPEVLHAERNALDKLAKGSEGGLGSTMFITHAPCLECAKSIYGAGIQQVFYGEEYRSRDGIEFLEKCRVEVQQVKQ
jgi:dCMP deaminase